MKGKTYRLKLMVAARFLAEVSVLVILTLAPAVLFFTGHLAALPFQWKIVVCGLAAVSAVALPCYALMPFAVRLGENDLTTFALVRKKTVPFSKVKAVKLITALFWRRYVLDCGDDELTFPVWIEGHRELVEAIRERLPSGMGKGSPLRAYRQDMFASIFQVLRVVLGASFIAVVWSFYQGVGLAKSTSQADSLLLLAFGILGSAVVGWRCIVIALMPRAVELSESAIRIKSLCFDRTLAWTDVKGIKPTFFLLPEGFMLDTRRGSYFIGDNLDSSDELVDALKGRLAKSASA